MVRWTCASALCFDNYSSKDANGEPIGFYRLPCVEVIQNEHSYTRKAIKIQKTFSNRCNELGSCSSLE